MQIKELLQTPLHTKKNNNTSFLAVKTLNDFFNHLINQHHTVNTLRTVFPEKNDAYQDFKTQNIPVFYFNCMFKTNQGASKKNIKEGTGFLYFDIDPKNEKDYQKQISKLKQLPFVLGAWRSAGGKGIGFIIKVNGTATDEHFNYIQANYLEDFNLDGICFHLNRACCISYDPDYYFNENAIAIELPSLVQIDETKKANQKTRKKSEIVYKQTLLKELENGEVRDTMTQIEGFNAFFVKDGFCSSKQLNVYKVKQIKVGQRYTKLSWYTHFLILVGAVRYNNVYREVIESKVRYINETFCEELFPEDELKEIFDTQFKKYDSYEFDFSLAHNKKLLLDPNIEVKTTNWYKMVNKGTGLSKINNNKELIKITIQHLHKNSIKITNKNISDYSKKFDNRFYNERKGVSIRTLETTLYRDYKFEVIESLTNPVVEEKQLEVAVTVDTVEVQESINNLIDEVLPVIEEKPVEVTVTVETTEIKETINDLIELDEYTKAVKRFEKRYNRSAHEPLPDSFKILSIL